MAIEVIKYNQVDRAKKQVDDAVKQHQKEIHCGILQTVCFSLVIITQYHLYTDQDAINRCAEKNKNLFK